MDLTESQTRAVTRVAASLGLADDRSVEPSTRPIAIFRPETAVALAVELLADGIETPSAVDLASLPVDVRDLHREDVEPLARSMMVELGISLPVDTAAWVMGRSLDIAMAMAAGKTSPQSGAAEIWVLSSENGGACFKELRGFIAAASSWDEIPDKRRELAEDALRAATDLLSRHGGGLGASP